MFCVGAMLSNHAQNASPYPASTASTPEPLPADGISTPGGFHSDHRSTKAGETCVPNGRAKNGSDTVCFRDLLHLLQCRGRTGTCCWPWQGVTICGLQADRAGISRPPENPDPRTSHIGPGEAHSSGQAGLSSFWMGTGRGVPRPSGTSATLGFRNEDGLK